MKYDKVRKLNVLPMWLAFSMKVYMTATSSLSWLSIDFESVSKGKRFGANINDKL